MYNPLARMRNFYYITGHRASIFGLNCTSYVAPQVSDSCERSKQGTMAVMDKFLERKNEFFAREKILYEYAKTVTQMVRESDYSDERFLEIFKEQ